jgi:hypothetical protein
MVSGAGVPIKIPEDPAHQESQIINTAPILQSAQAIGVAIIFVAQAAGAGRLRMDIILVAPQGLQLCLTG